MSGHVFVVHGDLTRLACDAILLPTDARLTVLQTWLKGPLAKVDWEAVYATVREGYGQKDGPRTFRAEGVPEGYPQLWPTRTAAPSRADPELNLAGMRQFVREAALEAWNRGPRMGRARPLLGLPLVGTGGGGKAFIRGDMAQMLLPELRALAAESRADLALVLIEPGAHAAVQALRRRGRDSWPELSLQTQAKARTLARLAVRGELVLFMGAGVGVGAGLPLWGGLLDALAEDVGLDTISRARLRHLNVLDRARVILGRLPPGRRREDLGERITRLLHREHYGLAHGLLAAVPAREAITTNYDPLFEMARASIRQPTATLPFHAAEPEGRWLLKLHGCVTEPGSIVLTRDDYLRYAEDHAALQGIVQALLLTRHILFVGFSLDDDNFHRIADSVRRVLKRQLARSGQPALGTALLPHKSDFAEELWGDDIDWLAMGDAEPGAEAKALAQAGRKVEVFLDLLACEATHAADHLLDPSFSGALTEGERDLRDLLRDLAVRVAQLPDTGVAGDRVDRLLGELGDHAARLRALQKRS